MKKTGGKEIFGKSLRSQRHMVKCRHHDKKIFNQPEFRGKYNTCFDILHSEECKGLFSVIHANIVPNNCLPEAEKRWDTK